MTNGRTPLTDDDLELLIEGRQAFRSGRAKEIREVAGLSQNDMADLVGVTTPAVCRWETMGPNGRAPSKEHAIAYAKALRRVKQLMEAAS